MNSYLVNNTDWPLTEVFLSDLMTSIEEQLPAVEKERLIGKEVGVVLIDEVKMTELNEQFRGKKGPTDILSFNGDDESLGELILCVELIDKQAKEHKLEPCEELAYLVIHGLLHLLGHDHEVAAEEKKMFAIQDKIFDVLMDRGIVKQLKDEPHG